MTKPTTHPDPPAPPVDRVKFREQRKAEPMSQTYCHNCGHLQAAHEHGEGRCAEPLGMKDGRMVSCACLQFAPCPRRLGGWPETLQPLPPLPEETQSRAGRQRDHLIAATEELFHAAALGTLPGPVREALAHLVGWRREVENEGREACSYVRQRAETSSERARRYGQPVKEETP